MKNNSLSVRSFYDIKEVIEAIEKVVLFIIPHDLT